MCSKNSAAKLYNLIEKTKPHTLFNSVLADFEGKCVTCALKKKQPMSTVPDRLKYLRKHMEDNGIEACIIPTDDVHQSEYVSPHFKYRAYLSGFSGSAGVLVVAKDAAGLWTDSRYYLQAEKQLSGSGITMYGTTLPETPSIEKWLLDHKYKSIGFDGEVYAAGKAMTLVSTLEKEGCRIDSNYKSYQAVWPDRPALPDDKIYVYGEQYAGESFHSKLEEVRRRLHQAKADTLPVSGLDDIAWLFNLRGNDVMYNPVGLCFALIQDHRVCLFADRGKLTDEAISYLTANNVELHPYDGLPGEIRRLPASARIFIDRMRINYAIYSSIPAGCTIIEGIMPVTDMKSVKNSTELSGYKEAILKDGVTLLRLWRWFEDIVMNGGQTDEYAIAEQLINTRLSDSGCMGESFEPIVSFNSNGAIVHYSPSPETSAKIHKNGILLIDSGGQYIEGTTDITRTYSLYEGDTTPEEYLKDYALVLKGNIALAESIFPANTRGSVIDAFTRQFMWKAGINYGHGTGHGIGHFLNVHEGPQSIRMEENPVTIKPGMVMSDEPGIYKAGKYGIRVENMIHCVEKFHTDFGCFLGFETLTLFPLDRKSIDPQYYTKEEIDWINNYQARTYEALAPLVTPEECSWLKDKTQPILK